MSKTVDLGPVSAYALAVKHGYTGTEEEWVAEMEAKRLEAVTAASNAQSAATAASQSKTASANSATASANSATASANSASAASGSATEAESYARGGTGSRAGEDTDNAKYYYEKAKNTEIGKVSEEVAGLSNDIGVLSARLDNIASLPEGSTTADAELQDIRVGQDGRTYNTAGEAVREQVGELKGDLGDLKYEVNSTNNKVNDNTEDITDNKNDISEIQQILDRLTELKEVVLTDENEEAILTEQGDLITVLVRYVKTDNTLLDEFLPANAKAVGDALKFYVDNYDIPIISLHGDISNMTKDVKATLNYNFNIWSGICDCKWQGSSSLSYPKKNYTITFDKNLKIVDEWGSHKKYVLKANYIDFSHCRNIVGAKLWGEICKNRTTDTIQLLSENGDFICTENNIQVTTDFLPYSLVNAGAVDGFPIALLINDEYVGLYTLSIPKDKWLFGMSEYPNSAILSAENTSSLASRFYSIANIDGEDFDYEYVASTESEVKTSLNRMITTVIDSNADNFDSTVSQYLDVDSAIDYFIFSLVTGNIDGLGRNYLLATYDGDKWFFSAYDLDSTFGNSPFSDYYINPSEQVLDYFTQHNLFNKLMQYKKNEVLNRFNKLKNSVLSVSSILTIFSNYEIKIPLALKNEEVKLWNKLKGTSSNNVNQVIMWYTQRLKIVESELNK